MELSNAQMMGAIASLPGPDLLEASKLTDPLGANFFYSARTVVKILAEEREACAKLCEEQRNVAICAVAIRARSTKEPT